MTWYQEWFGEEYLDLYSYRDEDEARRQVDFFASRIGPIARAVLDLACGSGRHLQELRSRGYQSFGCDLSYILLRTAIRDVEASVARADMRRLPFANASFGGMVNFFTSFGYFETEHDNLEVVREMARVLAPGAPFLFDYLNVQRELDRLVPREVKKTEKGEVVIDRWFDSARRTFNKRITIGSRSFLERVRAYDLDEITVLFAAAGFALHHVFGDFDGRSFDEESARLIVVGAKI